MFGEGMVSLGVAAVTIVCSVWKSSPKIVCSRRTLPSILSAAEPVDEVHETGGAAELAVGGGLQADVALHRVHLADRVVLDPAQLLVGDAAGGVVVACLEQPPRA